MQHQEFAGLLRAIDAKLDSQPPGANRRLIFLACLMVLILDGLDLQLLAFAAPLLAQDLGADKVALSTALGVTLVGMATGAPCGGWIGDRFGPRRSLILAAFAFGLATLAMTWARDMGDIRALRLISGFGFGAAIPNAMALAGSWSGPRRRGPLIALLALGTPIGAVFGGLLSAWLMPRFGWRSAFLISGCFTLGLAVATTLFLPESPAFLLLRGKKDQALALLAKFAGPEFASAMPAGGQPISASAQAVPGLLSRSTLRTNLTLWMTFFGVACAAYAYFSWFPTILVDAGFPLITGIHATAVYSFSSIGGSLLATACVSRIQPRTIILPSLIVKVATTCLLGLALFRFGAGPVPILMGLAGLCCGLAQTGLYVLTASSYPASQTARALGFGVGFSRMGGIFTMFGGGAILSISPSGAEIFFAAMALMLLMAIVAMYLFRPPATDRAISSATAATPSIQQL